MPARFIEQVPGARGSLQVQRCRWKSCAALYQNSKVWGHVSGILKQSAIPGDNPAPFWPSECGHEWCMPLMLSRILSLWDIFPIDNRINWLLKILAVSRGCRDKISRSFSVIFEFLKGLSEPFLHKPWNHIQCWSIVTWTHDVLFIWFSGTNKHFTIVFVRW